MKKGSAFVLALRPHFSIMWVLMGIIGASFAGIINIQLFIVTLIGLLFSALGMHYLDEALDWELGRDKEYGGMGTVRSGTLKLFELKAGVVVFFAIATGCGGYLVLHTNLWLLLFILGGVGIMLSNHITEEITLVKEWVVCIGLGLLLMGSYYVQTLTITLPIVLFTMFMALILVPVIVLQDIPDYEVDKKSKKNTLVVRFGIKNGTRIGILHFTIGLIPLILWLYWM